MANIKKSFYHIVEYFKDKSNHVEKILLGPACENWIRSEAAFALNNLKKGPFRINPKDGVSEESEKRDLSIIHKGNKTHVVELKVIYPNNKMADQLKELKNQLSKTKKGDQNASKVGWVFGIWTSAYGDKYHKIAFFKELRHKIQICFPEGMFTFQRNTLSGIIEHGKVKYWDGKYDVCMKMIYFTMRGKIK